MATHLNSLSFVHRFPTIIDYESRAMRNQTDVREGGRKTVDIKRQYPILISAYNGASTIGETLASLLNQSSAVLASVAKVVIADDGSTDDTRSVVLQYWCDGGPRWKCGTQSVTAASVRP